jgi:hypothetical protein
LVPGERLEEEGAGAGDGGGVFVGVGEYIIQDGWTGPSSFSPIYTPLFYTYPAVRRQAAVTHFPSALTARPSPSSHGSAPAARSLFVGVGVGVGVGGG